MGGEVPAPHQNCHLNCPQGLLSYGKWTLEGKGRGGGGGREGEGMMKGRGGGGRGRGGKGKEGRSFHCPPSYIATLYEVTLN